jgi:protein gp37
MSDRSAIEWTDASWNPIRARNLKTGKVGWHCEHVTTGCERCYAEGINKRLGTGLPFKPGHRKDVEIFLDEKMLRAPRRWAKPRKIFVCSMTDLFADFVKDEWLDRIFATMLLSPHHTFQVLTKRPERMRAYTTSERAIGPVEAQKRWWPLPNVWLGVSCERQEEADERIPLLLQTPAAVRFISAEPLLGPIRLMRIPVKIPGEPGYGDCQIDWCIVGGESGPNASPMHPDWARSLRDQCQAAGVAFFFKQWGAWRLTPADNGDETWPAQWPYPGQPRRGDVARLERVGKKAAGRLLDGREHSAFPEIAAS